MLSNLLNEVSRNAAVVCDTVEPFANFDVLQYMGTWYAIAHTKNEPFRKPGSTCVTAQYSNFDAETNKFITFNSGQNESFNARDGIFGTATQYDDEPAGWVEVSFSGKDQPGVLDGVNYQVFDTDYTSYALVYNCDYRESEGDNFPFLFILARTPTLPQDTLDSLVETCIATLPNYDFTQLEYDVQDETCVYPPDSIVTPTAPTSSTI